MTFVRLPLTAKLTAINTLLAVSLLALVAVAWRHLPSSDDATELAQLGRAQRAAQNADMMHDALHADVLAALLAGNHSAHQRDDVQRSLRANAQEFRAEFAALANMPLGLELKPHFDAAREAGLSYVERVEQMVQLALTDPKQAMAQHETFHASFEATKHALATQTSLIAKHVDAANAEAKRATEDARRWLLGAALLTGLGGWIGVALIARSIRHSLMRICEVARAVAAGDLERRMDDHGGDEVGQIATSVNQMADALSKMIVRMRGEAERSDFSAQLVTALDMSDSEKQACQVVEHAMNHISADHGMELLLSDSSEAHLERAAQHPSMGAPGCSVDSPLACVAVRRGHAVSFEHSDALDACPKLRDRPVGAVSATCVPVAFMGRPLGVLHACGPVSQPLSADARDRLNALGTQVGARLGTVRAFESTQLQARTDALTGLANRRAAEARMRELARIKQPFAFVMADLDRFKLLNDTYGHKAGDEALRAFADVARDCLRQHDMACRWGGEEFCFLLVDADAQKAVQWVDRMRARLAQELQRRSVPLFTASFGVADSESAVPIESVVTAADMALYRAKAEGRDRGVQALQTEFEARLPIVRQSEPSARVDLKALAAAD